MEWLKRQEKYKKYKLGSKLKVKGKEYTIVGEYSKIQSTILNIASFATSIISSKVLTFVEYSALSEIILSASPKAIENTEVPVEKKWIGKAVNEIEVKILANGKEVQA